MNMNGEMNGTQLRTIVISWMRVLYSAVRVLLSTSRNISRKVVCIRVRCWIEDSGGDGRVVEIGLDSISCNLNKLLREVGDTRDSSTGIQTKFTVEKMPSGKERLKLVRTVTWQREWEARMLGPQKKVKEDKE